MPFSFKTTSLAGAALINCATSDHAAVVKGTRFVVILSSRAARLSVHEGLVDDLATGDGARRGGGGK